MKSENEEFLQLTTFAATCGYPHDNSRITERPCYVYATPLLQRIVKNTGGESWLEVKGMQLERQKRGIGAKAKGGLGILA